MKRHQHKLIIPPLQVADFICRHCNVQATCDGDHICGICKAIGKSVEPQKASRHEAGLAAMLAKPITHWFIEHHLIVLNEALMPTANKADKTPNGIGNITNLASEV